MLWALVGAGNIARQYMIAALRAVPGSSIGWVQTGSLSHGADFAAAATLPGVHVRYGGL